MPFEVLKKTMLSGIGLALKTKEELEELAKEYITKGEMNENEGKKFVDDLQKKYEEAKEKFEDKIEKTVKKMMTKADIATKTEINDLKKKLTDLKKEIADLKK